MSFFEKTDADILKVANTMMDNLMQASTDLNHEQHCVDFSDRLRTIVTKPYFDNVCKSYQAEKGFFTTREFVGLFRRPHSVAILWKQNFSGQKGDYVAEMVLIEHNGKVLVDHVMVF